MSVKGFLRIANLANNKVGQVAVLGELSERALSSSIEHNYHTAPGAFPGIEYATFHNRGHIDNPVPPPPLYGEVYHVLEIGFWMYQQALAGYFTENRQVFLQAISVTFPDKIGKIDCGKMISNGELWLPEWVSWQRLNNDGNGTVTLGLPVKVWLADASLRRQFPDYDIAILTPLARLDDFFLPKEDVKAKLAERGYAKMFSDLAELTAAAPYTVSVAQEYDWVDRIDRDYKLNTVWVVGVWGEAGKSPDVIREELVDYILKHSNHPRSDWEEILPELFISTEFIIVPNWDQYAIENQTVQAGLYSPQLKVSEGLALAKRGIPQYTLEHLTQYTRYMTHPYRSLGFVVCGGPRNIDRVMDFYEKFQDYLSLPSTHDDFDRISPRTQQWMLQFATGLLAAESLNDDSELPKGFARVRRNNILYLGFTYEKISYLIVTKTGIGENTGLVPDVTGDGTYARQNAAWVETLSADEFDQKLAE